MREIEAAIQRLELSLRSDDPLDERGRRDTPARPAIADDAAAAGFDGVAADDLIRRPVGALHQHVRLNARMMSAGVSSSKIDHGVDAVERREHLGALVLRVDRPAGPLLRRTDASALRPTISSVAERAGVLEIAHVPGMQQIEHAVGEDDRWPASRSDCDERRGALRDSMRPARSSLTAAVLAAATA